MSYSCLEELQVDLDLHTLDKTPVLSKAGRRYDDGWLVITNNGYCHLFDKDGNLDDIKKITQLKEEHIRKDWYVRAQEGLEKGLIDEIISDINVLL